MTAEPLEIILIGIGAVLLIALASAVAPRLRLPAPVLLVVVGIVISLIPAVPLIQVDPEIILVGILPPLLYSSAISLPAIEFRRDLAPIAGLAVVLVVLSSAVLGVVFLHFIPVIGVFLAIALGAILSPTDAVATSIVKRLGISRRVTTMLDGESLLNDATALVLVTTMVAAFTNGHGSGDVIWIFVRGVLIALVVGGIVGWINLRLRAWVGAPAANTAIGFIVPFAAYVPTEQLGGSGLVAAVVAGLVTAQGAARRFTPEQRISDAANWRTIELMLEGAVFLIMGLEIESVLAALGQSESGILRAAALAGLALVLILLVRAIWVSILVWAQSSRARSRRRTHLEQFGRRFHHAAEHSPEELKKRMRGRSIASVRARLARAFADLDYYRASPIGWKHGTIIVWAGMRGVVTLAAAQTLPRDAPERPTLIFIAFLVAAGSLFFQSVTLPMVVRWLRIDDAAAGEFDHAEHERLRGELRQAAADAISTRSLRAGDGEPFPPELMSAVAPRFEDPPETVDTEVERQMLRLRLALIEVQRARLLELSSDGTFSSATLRRSLDGLDADQISIELRMSGTGED
ncbi:sodium:proton antiporter [Microbacterium sp. RU33B]|uniref:cation:proton antiporter n=1 Tax=Microbacterium sp. RU33B TaxID=1907390 RepID=UPI00096758B3|nr:cation:proton antiporter [Microbacterium sp. RU33B]SIT84444.1 sodium/proton antiporter, CPA1 family [Microbacterium sp. RU33B]